MELTFNTIHGIITVKYSPIPKIGKGYEMQHGIRIEINLDTVYESSEYSISDFQNFTNEEMGDFINKHFLT